MPDSDCPPVSLNAPPACRVDFSRRSFLGVALFSLSAGACLLSPGCGAALMTYLGDLSSTTISVPKPDRSLLPGEFFRVRARGFPDPIIVRRLRDGSLLALSAVCTHKGCEVRPGPRSFECPCHGSAYHEDGTVKEGPATRPLERFPIRETEHGYLIEVIS